MYNNNKRKISFKSIFVVFLFGVLLFGKAISLPSFVFATAPPIEETELQELELLEKQESLASSVSLSDEVLMQASLSSEPVTIYNFVAPLVFKNEEASLSKIWEYGQNHFSVEKSYSEVFKEMFNTGRYSVKEYYKNMTNGQVILESVFVSEEDAVKISEERSHFLIKSSSNPSGYIAGESSYYDRRYFLLSESFKAVVDFLGSSSEYKDLADFNDDGFIDSVSFVVLPKSNDNLNDPDWAELLWSHKSSLFGVNFKNSYGESIGSNGYMLNYLLLETSDGFSPTAHIDNTMQTPSSNTAIHEIGHLVFNLPDLYVYSDSSKRPVGWWDIMASSSLQRSQYMTSYLRLKAKWGDNQGFIKDNQVIEIKEQGEYTLQPVNYEEVNERPFSFNRTVAYKLVNPDNNNQSIYIEYRKQNKYYFDGEVNLESGLLVYLVDEGTKSSHTTFPTGNASGQPYNLYVFRGEIYGKSDSFALQLATINCINKSYGENKTYGPYNNKTPNLLWPVYDEGYQGLIKDIEYVDSGIVIRYKNENLNNQSITFEVEWDRLPEKNEIVDKNEIEDLNLYIALKNVLGPDSQEISLNDFLDFDVIDLSGEGISSLEGLEKLNFKTDVFIDLSNNNLTSLGKFEDIFKTELLDGRINLAFNKIKSLEGLESCLDRVVLAMQKPSFNKMYYSANNKWDASERNLLFHRKDYSDLYTLEKDYPESLNSGMIALKTAGDFYFSFVDKSKNEVYRLDIKVGIVNLIEQTTEINVLEDSFNLNEYLEFKDIDIEQIYYEILDSSTGNAIDKDEISKTIGLKRLKFRASDLKVEIDFNLNVVDKKPPTIGFVNVEKTILFKGEIFNVEEFFEIKDNYDKLLKPKIKQSFSSAKTGKFELEIYAEDSSKNKSETMRFEVVVVDVEVLKNVVGEVLEDFNYLDCVIFQPVEYENEFEFKIIKDVNIQTIGKQEVKFKIYHKEFVDIEKEISFFVDIKDTQAPIISFKENETDIYVYYGKSPSLPVPEITDNFYSLEKLNINSTYINSIHNKIGKHFITYIASDPSGNKSEKVITITILPKPIEYLEIIKVSKIANITPNTSIEFKVDKDNPSLSGRTNITLAWFVNGEKVKESKDDYLNYFFKQKGKYVVEVKAEYINESGQKTYSSFTHEYVVPVGDGGILDKYSVPAIIVLVTVVIIILSVSVIRRKRRKMFF